MDIQVESPVKTTSSVSRAVLAAVGITEAARAAFYVLLTAFIAYQYQMVYGFAPARTQGLVTIAVLVTLLRPLIGFITDVRPIGRHRRKNLLLLGNFLYGTSITMLLVVPGPASAAGYLTIVASFMLYGAGESLLGVGCDSLALDVGTTDGKKNGVKTMQRIGAMGGLVIAYVAGAFLIGAAWTWFLISIGIMIALGTIATLRVNEPPITIEQARALIHEQGPSIPASYKTTLWVAATLMLVSALGEGLVNVQLEPYLIARYGNAATAYYFTELSGAIIAMGALGGVAVSKYARKGNLGKLIIPAAIVTIAYYVCLQWFAPTLFIYVIWVSAKGTGAMIFTFAVERILMDVVQGARKGGTYQVFNWFTTAGGVAGTWIGSILGSIMPFAMLLVITGLVDAAALALYLFVLAPRLKLVINNFK
ncbi:MAG TPA: MFS transporter [Candidatus Lokiarchaeia archaeon]|nr:MFS transporter [Candidatus Lokiarchaeia archaeon]